MKEKIKKILNSKRSSLLLLFLLEFVLMFFITPNKADDKIFLESVTGTSIWSYVAPRYFNWTSRFLIEYILCLVLKTSKYLWILVEAMMVALAGFSISKLFIKDNTKENNLMLLFMILIYPLDIMNSAGWAATTVNYMWPLATCLFALIPIRKIWDNEKIKFWEYPLYTIALIFAGNQEQTCAILFGAYILFAILMIIKNQKIHPYMIIQTILIIASLVFILTCPGNYVRKNYEIETYFKNFGMLTVFDKIGLGFTSTMGCIMKEKSLVYLLLTSLITIYVFSNYKEKLYRIIALEPLISTILGGYVGRVTNDIFPYFGSFASFITRQEMMLTAGNSNNLMNVVPVIFSLANFICIGLSILLIFKNLKNNIAIIVYIAGLLSRLIIGFSPTVFTSGARTSIFLDFAMIIVSLLIWQEFIKKDSKEDRKIQAKTEFFIKLLGVLQYINVLICVLIIRI